MTLYDSSVLIDYLDGLRDTIAYIQDHIDDRAVAPPLVLFEVYQGEVFKTGPTDLDAVDGALEWLHVVDVIEGHARVAAELQDHLAVAGTPLTARDAFVAGSALALDEPLAVADTDFDIEGLDDLIRIDFL